jgi:hypothetical protein
MRQTLGEAQSSEEIGGTPALHALRDDGGEHHREHYIF